MKQKEIVIKNKTGLHARPASEFVKAAYNFKSNIIVKKGEIEINGKSIMGILTLAASYNTRIIIIADGEDEDKAIEVLSKILETEEKA